MAAAPAAIPSLDATFGAMFIGVILAATLYGVTCLQTWSYFRDYPEDTWRIKTLVLAVFISDTVHQALITQSVYEYLVTHYFDPTYLGLINRTLLIEVLFNGFTAVMVQSYFILRIWRLSKGKLWLALPVVAFAIAQFLVTIIYTAKGLKLTGFDEMTDVVFQALSISINGTTVATDVSIAAILCGLLHGSRTGFRRTDNMINKLMIFSVNTGLLTSIDAICSLAFVVAFPHKLIYVCFFFCLGRLYSNSLLGTLNFRKVFRENTTHEDSVSGGVALGTMNRGQTSVNALGQCGDRNVQQTMQDIAIKIDTTKEYATDHDSDYHRAIHRPDVKHDASFQ
ncbi:hypothetical protein EVG20_g2896 [Dentipellis fragilis]|uniref:DUF6534 domain-containing protein n=1 Tax=Dentipellis fragilis TaxID=205917 RepID=A0A4Y9Z5P3_9AGAM|nr:hypothetical protein EVG20_g2896 [Dentipellis fragilis]